MNQKPHIKERDEVMQRSVCYAENARLFALRTAKPGFRMPAYPIMHMEICQYLNVC